MVSKQQNKCTLLCVGFVIGFVSGYSYRQLLLRSGDLPRSKQSFFEAKKKNKKSKKRHDRVPAELEVEADPTNYFSTSYRDTYATLGELVETESGIVRSSGDGATGLTLRQKYSLMEDFSYIISMPYAQACQNVSSKGYKLCVISVQGSSQKMSSKTYPSNTFGVEICDSNYNFQIDTPSKKAVVVSIINVGALE